MSGDPEHAQAASIIDRALALNPNSAHAWLAKGWIASHQNQPCPAIEAFEHAIRLSPLDPLGSYFSGGLALANLAAGRYEKASDWADRALREMSRSTLSIRTKMVSCAHLGRIDEAREWLGRLLDIQPASTIGAWKAVTFLPPEIVAKYVEGLRKAGLPEE
jgi:adenylate cyclase